MGLEAFESREWVDVVDMVYVCACISGFGGEGGERVLTGYVCEDR